MDVAVIEGVVVDSFDCVVDKDEIAGVELARLPHILSTVVQFPR